MCFLLTSTTSEDKSNHDQPQQWQEQLQTPNKKQKSNNNNYFEKALAPKTTKIIGMPDMQILKLKTVEELKRLRITNI